MWDELSILTIIRRLNHQYGGKRTSVVSRAGGLRPKPTKDETFQKLFLVRVVAVCIFTHFSRAHTLNIGHLPAP